jgi:hypothetical protein
MLMWRYEVMVMVFDVMMGAAKRNKRSVLCKQKRVNREPRVELIDVVKANLPYT